MVSEAKVGKLMHISVSTIVPNPQNPRLLFDKEPLKSLENSIREVGILNPLLVYRREKDDKIVILDGERRWICARNIGLETVPANIIEEPTPLENIIRMFNIHKIREDWELMPTALKLEVIMRETKRSSYSELVEITNLPLATVKRCKILLSYSKNYQDLMLTKDPKDRINTDFFIELSQVLNLIEKNLERVSSAFTRDKIISIFLRKYSLGSFTNVIHFRKIADLIRSIKKGIPKKDVEDKIIEFLSNEKSTFDEISNVQEEFSQKISLKKNFEKLGDRIDNIQVDSIKKDSDLLDSLLKLKKIIDKKVKEIQEE